MVDLTFDGDCEHCMDAAEGYRQVRYDPQLESVLVLTEAKRDLLQQILTQVKAALGTNARMTTVEASDLDDLIVAVELRPRRTKGATT